LAGSTLRLAVVCCNGPRHRRAGVTLALRWSRTAAGRCAPPWRWSCVRVVRT